MESPASVAINAIAARPFCAIMAVLAMLIAVVGLGIGAGLACYSMYAFTQHARITQELQKEANEQLRDIARDVALMRLSKGMNLQQSNKRIKEDKYNN